MASARQEPRHPALLTGADWAQFSAEEKQLPYPYAPLVYSAQLDDFYWWANHADTPIVDVMIAVNRQMLAPRRDGAPWRCARQRCQLTAISLSPVLPEVIAAESSPHDLVSSPARRIQLRGTRL